MTPKSEFGSRVKFFFWKFSLEMIEFILIRNPNEILRVKLSKLGFHFQNFIPYKKQPKSHYLQNPNFSLFTWIFGVLETLKSGLINYRDRKKLRFSKINFFRRPWRRTASRALGYQHVLFEKYRIYDGSLEVRVGRRLMHNFHGLWPIFKSKGVLESQAKCLSKSLSGSITKLSLK